MEIHLNYPAKGYIKSIKKAVNAGDTIHVIITKPKLAVSIKGTLSDLYDEKESTSSFFRFFARWFGLTKFLAGHFYAEAAGYGFTFIDITEPRVTYVKNT